MYVYFYNVRHADDSYWTVLKRFTININAKQKNNNNKRKIVNVNSFKS